GVASAGMPLAALPTPRPDRGRNTPGERRGGSRPAPPPRPPQGKRPAPPPCPSHAAARTDDGSRGVGRGAARPTRGKSGTTSPPRAVARSAASPALRSVTGSEGLREGELVFATDTLRLGYRRVVEPEPEVLQLDATAPCVALDVAIGIMDAA